MFLTIKLLEKKSVLKQKISAVWNRNISGHCYLDYLAVKYYFNKTPMGQHPLNSGVAGRVTSLRIRLYTTKCFSQLFSQHCGVLRYSCGDGNFLQFLCCLKKEFSITVLLEVEGKDLFISSQDGLEHRHLITKYSNWGNLGSLDVYCGFFCMPLKMLGSHTYGDIYYPYHVTLYPHTYSFMGGFKEERSFFLVFLKCNHELKCIPV